MTDMYETQSADPEMLEVWSVGMLLWKKNKLLNDDIWTN